jgi:hypothetical protein
MGWSKTTILWYSVFLKPCCDMSPSIATQGGKKSHRNGSMHLVPALDARAQTSNIQYETHKPFRDEAFKQITKAHEEWQARHGYARADNNHEACYVNWLLAGRVSRLCWSLKGRRSCMKSTFKCWRFQYGIKFWITLCLHLERQWKKT